jgi:DNA-binding response OmpR family regulator
MNNKILNNLKSSSILVVDDCLNTRKILVNLLSLYIGKIYEASDGIEGLEIFNTLNPSIIITDIEMPRMNGLTFISKIRETNDDIPVIIISGFSTKEYLLKAVKLSLISYLEKPIKKDLLLSSLSKAAEFVKITKLFGEITIMENYIYDATNKKLVINNQYNCLSRSEICILELLILNRRSFITKDKIIDSCSLFRYKSDSYINNVVCKLRKKLGEDLIITIYRSGYILV